MAERTYRRSIERRLREVDEAMAVLEGIDHDWLYELMRRREQVVGGDGYGSSDLTSGRGGSSDTTPTERAALSVMAGCRRPNLVKFRTQRYPVCLNCGLSKREHMADAIGMTIEEVLALLDRATQALRSIPRKHTVIVNANDGRTGRQSEVTDCLACEKGITGLGNDVIRAGYCHACYEAWRRFRKDQGPEASHVVFRQLRAKAEPG